MQVLVPGPLRESLKGRVASNDAVVVPNSEMDEDGENDGNSEMDDDDEDNWEDHHHHCCQCGAWFEDDKDDYHEEPGLLITPLQLQAENSLM